MLFEKLQNLYTVQNKSDIFCNVHYVETIELGDEQQQIKKCLTLMIDVFLFSETWVTIGRNGDQKISSFTKPP
jgi:hypothetical protein